MTTQHRLTPIIFMCLFAWLCEHSCADEPELTAEEEAAMLEVYPNYRKIRDLKGKTTKEIVDKLRQMEAEDPLTSDRGFACEVIEGHLARSKAPQVTPFLLDWLEFRSQVGPVKNFLSVSDTDLYPAIGVLTKRGAEIVPQLLEHAVAGPRSSSYGYRARSLFLAVMPNDANRKKTIDDFAAEHPEKKAALAIFTPPIEVRARNYEEFKKQLEAAAKPPSGRDGDIYFSVGQWKRMVIDAKKNAAPRK